MQTRWRVHNLGGSSCLALDGPTNGPYHVDVNDSIQSYSGTLCLTIPFHAVIRRGIVDDPTYIMMSGTVYYSNTYGDWSEYLDGSVFSVQGVNSSGTAVLDGTIVSYTGGSAGNRTISFNPILSTEIWGLRFCVSGSYPPSYIKVSSILDLDLHTSDQYVKLTTPPAPDPYYGRLIGISAAAYEYDSYDIGSGVMEYRMIDTDGYGTENYIQKVYVDILPATTGSGVLYYLESSSGPNSFIRSAGWSWWLGPPPPSGYIGYSYYMGLAAWGTSGWLSMGMVDTWPYGGPFTPSYYEASDDPAWIKFHERLGNYARMFFTRPGPLATRLTVSSGFTESLGSFCWYLKNLQSLRADFGYADTATRYKVDIDTIDIYNYCPA